MERHAFADTATMVRVTTTSRPEATAEFGEAVARHHTELARFAYRLCGDAGRAEDAVAEAYARVWPRWRRGQVDELYPYLRQAVVHQIYGGHRRRLLELREAERRRPEPAAPAFERQIDDRAQLWAALARLSPSHRAVVVLRLVEDLSEDEAAGLLGIAPGTVKSRLSRALDHLRRLVEVDDV
jgi:RNA polymerase sigma-70 factor (sigma-E family)